MVKQIMILILFSLWPLVLWAAGNNSAAGGLPAQLTDQISQLSAQITALQKDVTYLKQRMAPQAVDMTVCGSSDIFADGDFTAGGQVGAGGTGGAGAELLGNGVKGEFSGEVSASHSAGVGAGTQSQFQVCVDLNELAAIIQQKQAAGETLTDLETFALNLDQNSASVEQRLLRHARDRLNANAMLASQDSDNSLYALGNQIDYLDQNLSDATVLPIRIQMVASSGLLVALPNRLQTRLTQPWGVVPTVSDLSNSCSTLSATLQEDVCGDVESLGGLTLADVNNTLGTIKSTVNSVSNDVASGFAQTQQGINQGINQTKDGFAQTQQQVTDSTNETVSKINDTATDTANKISGDITDATNTIKGLFDNLGTSIFGSGSSSGGSGGGGGGGLLGDITSTFCGIFGC